MDKILLQANVLIWLPLLSAGCAATCPPQKSVGPAPSDFTAAIAWHERVAGDFRRMLEADQGATPVLFDEGDVGEVGIESIGWVSTLNSTSGGFVSTCDYRLLSCWLTEWPGYPALDRFLGEADLIFFLEAPGCDSIGAQMVKGGIADLDEFGGSTLLLLHDRPMAGVEYHLRPRNDNRRYRWALAGDLVVVAG